MKHPIVVALAVAAVCAACIGETVPGPLVGDWGGSFLQVSATRSGVQMNLGCAAMVQIQHPVWVDASGNFTVMDSLRGAISGGAFDTLPNHPVVAVAIRGNVTGDRLTITLPAGAGVYPVTPATGFGTTTYTGLRGAPEPVQFCRT